MSDTITPTSEGTTFEEAPPRRLVRVREGRWLGGVAAGLGRYFDVNPLVYRIAFAALAFAGGTGLLLYLAAWLVMPSEDREESIAVDTLRRHRDHPWLVLGVGLLSFGVLLALSEARFWPGPGNVWLAAILAGAAVVWWHVSGRERETRAAPVTQTATPAPVAQPAPAPKRPSLLAPAAGALLAAAGVMGLLDVVGAYEVDLAVAFAVALAFVGVTVAAGAATGRRVGGLVVLGLVLLACFGVAASTPVSLDAGIGDRVERPLDVGSLEPTYELGMGDLHVDLSQTPLPPGHTQVDAHVGIGELRITVPPEVAVELDAHAGIGDIEALGLQDDGAGVDIRKFFPGTTPDAPVLELDADVGLGAVEIRRG
jgi:phage shock protein PspC (stress-responsive transcriptional regulator)